MLVCYITWPPGHAMPFKVGIAHAGLVIHFEVSGVFCPVAFPAYGSCQEPPAVLDKEELKGGHLESRSVEVNHILTSDHALVNLGWETLQKMTW